MTLFPRMTQTMTIMMMMIVLFTQSVSAATLVFPSDLNANQSRLGRLLLIDPTDSGTFAAGLGMTDGMLFAKNGISTQGKVTFFDQYRAVKLTLASDGTIASSGNITSDGTIQSQNMIIQKSLKLLDSSCAGSPTTRCPLTVSPAGDVQITPASAATEDDVWRVPSRVYSSRGPTQTYFGEPSGLPANTSIFARIGIKTGAVDTNDPTIQLMVRGGIVSRKGLYAVTNNDATDPTNFNASAMRTKIGVTTDIDNSKIGRINTSTYTTETKVGSSNLVFGSDDPSVPTNIGINTPSAAMPGYSLDVVGDTLIRGIVVAGNNVGAVRSKVLGLQALNARPNYPSCNTAPAPYKCDTDADAADCGDDQTFGAPSTLTTNTYTCYDAYAPDNGVPNDGNSYNVYSIVKTVSSPLATFNPTTDKITFGGFTTTKHFAVTDNLFLHQSAIGRPGLAGGSSIDQGGLLQADANGLVSAIGNASFITDMISMVTKPVWERVNDLVYLIPAIKQVAIGITDKITGYMLAIKGKTVFLNDMYGAGGSVYTVTNLGTTSTNPGYDLCPGNNIPTTSDPIIGEYCYTQSRIDNNQYNSQQGGTYITCSTYSTQGACFAAMNSTAGQASCGVNNPSTLQCNTYQGNGRLMKPDASLITTSYTSYRSQLGDDLAGKALMVIDPAADANRGRVGIGTHTPQATLDVNGTTQFKLTGPRGIYSTVPKSNFCFLVVTPKNDTCLLTYFGNRNWKLESDSHTEGCKMMCVE